MKEKNIETQIIIFFRANGGYIQKVHSGAMMKSYTKKSGENKMYRVKLADEGTLDLMGCIRGQFIAIEVKKDEKEIAKWDRQKDKRSIAQHEQMRLIQEAGGITLIVCSFEEVQNDLRELGLIR